jgi:hypothetical protein
MSKIAKLLEEFEGFEDTQIDEITSLRNLKAIIAYGKKNITEDNIYEYIETIFDDKYQNAEIIKLWIDIIGGTENEDGIVELMKEDLQNYIIEEVL